MKRFAHLYRELDTTRRTSVKQAALAEYFRSAPPEDAAWTLYYLVGKKGRRVISSRLLRTWVSEVSGYPLWLIEESHDAVGDLAETISFLVPGPEESEADIPLEEIIIDRVQALSDLSETGKKRIVLQTWLALGRLERLLYTKLITGGFRVGVSKGIVIKALAEVAGVEQATMAHRLAGRWDPTPESLARLLSDSGEGGDPLQPYPFFLAYPAPEPIETLGDPSEFIAEWKWDGIRAQAVRRDGEHLIWSRGDDLIDEGFPEISDAVAQLPDGTVLDGELLAWKAGAPLSFHMLQRRLQRKSVSPRLMAQIPVRFLAYDLLEIAGDDLRANPIEDRRSALEDVLGSIRTDRIRLAPLVSAESWEELAELREESRERGTEGLMLKRRGSPYAAGRVRGDWWKWKIDPLSIDAVLVYAQRGSGRRASLYTDYTFAVWDDDELVPIAKAYSGLTDAEIRRVDNFVRRNITEKFGPVRMVKPDLVFELAFEGIQPSTRHKSGIALRFPRMARWREDKKPEDADTIETVRALLPQDTPIEPGLF